MTSSSELKKIENETIDYRKNVVRMKKKQIKKWKVEFGRLKYSSDPLTLPNIYQSVAINHCSIPAKTKIKCLKTPSFILNGGS